MNALVRKLENHLSLSEAERGALIAVTTEVHQVPARADLIEEGERPQGVNVLLTGLGARYKTLEDGRRRMLAILVPGDFCDLRNYILERMDHSILALTDIVVARLTPDAVEDLTRAHPRLLRALWWAQLVEQAITREWVMNTGQRTALERTAHLLCELFWRLRAVGLTRGDACELPITQIELGDTLGLSSVHVNRMLQELRREGLILLRDRELVIPDLGSLQSAALFEPGYLHLRGVEQMTAQVRDGPRPA